jgi:iron(III) transport system substrate-binding protein
MGHTATWPGRRRAGGLLGGAALVVGGLGLGACGSKSPSAAGPTASNSVVPLVLYAAEGYDANTAKAFTQATGIPVNLDDDSTGPLLTKIQAEKNNPKWSMLWVDGDTAFAQLDSEGLLAKGWEPSVAWNSTGQAVVPKDQSYIPTGLTMAGTFIYDSSKGVTPPTAWADLLAPQWAHEVGMNDPAISGPTYPFVAGMFNALGGVTQGENYFTQLQSNGLDVHETNGDTLQALTVGQIKGAIVQSSAAIGATLKDPSLKVAFLNPVTPIPSVIGIDAKDSPTVRAEAEKFVNFVFSAAGQQQMQTGDPHGDSLYWPVIGGVTPLPALPALTSIPAVPIDPYKWGAQEATINSWFTNNIA